MPRGCKGGKSAVWFEQTRSLTICLYDQVVIELQSMYRQTSEVTEDLGGRMGRLGRFDGGDRLRCGLFVLGGEVRRLAAVGH